MLTVLNPEGIGSVRGCVIRPKNAGGAPAPVSGITWSVDTANVAIEPAEDGMSCKVTAAAIGAARVSVSAQTKAGAPLTDSADFDVRVDEEAVTLGLTVG